jgi:hypothetical protein
LSGRNKLPEGFTPNYYTRKLARVNPLGQRYNKVIESFYIAYLHHNCLVLIKSLFSLNEDR